MRKQRSGNVVVVGSDQKGPANPMARNTRRDQQGCHVPVVDDCPFMTGALVSADGGYTCQ